jgi:3-hydroxybutyryl-CoA dehydratase
VIENQSADQISAPAGQTPDPIAGRSAICWSDPFEALSVGQRFRSPERTVRETDVLVFGALTGDRHPQHCDPEWAAASPFGGQIAHGMLILSLAVGLVPLDPERVLALRRVGDVVFKRPVRLNEVIVVVGELTALRSIDERSGLVDFSWAIRNREDALVARASVQVLWRGDGSAGERAAIEFWHQPILEGIAPGGFVPLPL